MGSIAGKIALVTGAGAGIGQEIALALARAGASVVVSGRRFGPLAETVTLIHAEGGKGCAQSFDIGDKTSLRAAFGRIKADLGPVDILVNNAGITYSKKFYETPDEVWEAIMQTNINGTFYCCKAALPDMIEKRWGRIITIASIAALGGLAYSSAYSASKHAQLGLTRSLALEVACYNITVNAICPGWVETAMLAEAIDNICKTTGRTAEEARASILNLSGQTRAVTPAEVATEVVRLASLDDPLVNGQAITLL